ncbi:MAG: hypothetical protein LBI48_02150 [Burkholderiaceae bacterium]|jgi:hypothetical protein|nr:hypothetical protein [Burkholderiaceae bacterium]
MHSKNKSAPTSGQRRSIERVKAMPCGVCGAAGPSEAHELRQGLWHTAIPLCPDCHRGGFNGIHGQQRIWKVKKLDELAVLDKTIAAVMEAA